MAKGKKKSKKSPILKPVIATVSLALIILAMWTWGWSVGRADKVNLSGNSNTFRMGNMFCIEMNNPGVEL